jgi:hypothetical protein
MAPKFARAAVVGEEEAQDVPFTELPIEEKRRRFKANAARAYAREEE